MIVHLQKQMKMLGGGVCFEVWKEGTVKLGLHVSQQRLWKERSSRAILPAGTNMESPSIAVLDVS